MESQMRAFMPQNMSMKVQPFSREWIVSFKDPRQLWTENWFALVLEVVSAVILLQVFRNAKKNGSQSAYVILAAITAAITFEILPFTPRRAGYLLWWYHQGLVNVLKQRVPSYVFTVYALVHYMAHSLTNKSNLPNFTRSVVTAICATLIMIPFLWLAPRLLLVLLHFDDPVFEDKIAGIPYIQIVLLLLLFFHTSHLFHQNYSSIEPQDKNTYSFIKCAIQSGFVSALYAIVEQYLLYILLHLILKANTVTCLIAAILILAYLAKDELKQMQMTSYSIQGIIYPVFRKDFWVIVAALLFTSTLPLWLNTHNLKSASDRLELGPCHIMQEVSNTSPLEISRRRYVCPDDATHLSFDFHCVTKKELSVGVNNRTKHYTVCGKHFENPYEIAKHFALYSTVCLTFFYVIMLFSFTFKVQVKPLADCKRVD